MLKKKDWEKHLDGHFCGIKERYVDCGVQTSDGKIEKTSLADFLAFKTRVTAFLQGRKEMPYYDEEDIRREIRRMVLCDAFSSVVSHLDFAGNWIDPTSTVINVPLTIEDCQMLQDALEAAIERQLLELNDNIKKHDAGKKKKK